MKPSNNIWLLDPFRRHINDNLFCYYFEKDLLLYLQKTVMDDVFQGVGTTIHLLPYNRSLFWEIDHYQIVHLSSGA